MSEAQTRARPPRRDVWREAPRVVLVCLLVALAIAASGGIRNGEGLFIVSGQAVSGGLIGLVVARWLVPASWYGSMNWAAALVIAACVAAPMTGIVLARIAFLEGAPITVALVREVAPEVFAVSLMMTALAFLVRRRPTQTHAAPRDAPAPKFLARLPAKLAGAEIYAVEAEDHYLRLHTSLGQDLILMRLTDAIAELEGIEGAQTHRSWWVARSAVTGAERLDGRALLTLKDGAEAPVSRGFAKALRAAGWY